MATGGAVYHVCSSSSGESVTGGSSTDESFTEEMFEEDGVCEILLVPKRKVNPAGTRYIDHR